MTFYLALAAASFTFVFLKAFQQQSVVAKNYIAIIPTSLAMAATEVFVVANVAAGGWRIGTVVAVGLASGLGAIAAMILHARIFIRKDP